MFKGSWLPQGVQAGELYAWELLYQLHSVIGFHIEHLIPRIGREKERLSVVDLL